jgi:hypothetical protein
MLIFPSILIENVQNYGFKAVIPQIVSYLVERGYRVTQIAVSDFLSLISRVTQCL